MAEPTVDNAIARLGELTDAAAPVDISIYHIANPTNSSAVVPQTTSSVQTAMIRITQQGLETAVLFVRVSTTANIDIVPAFQIRHVLNATMITFSTCERLGTQNANVCVRGITITAGQENAQTSSRPDVLVLVDSPECDNHQKHLASCHHQTHPL